MADPKPPYKIPPTWASKLDRQIEDQIYTAYYYNRRTFPHWSFWLWLSAVALGTFLGLWWLN